jgi:hypothetical protein
VTPSGDIMLQVLTLIACFLSGSLAGINIDGFVVRFPAWRHLGPGAWANYSRKADLGNGVFLYPFLAIGHTLLVAAVTIAIHYRGSAEASPAAYTATCFAIVGLLLTAQAAPIMLSLKRTRDDPLALETAFRGFVRWSLFRAVAQVLAFIATLDLLVRVSA